MCRQANVKAKLHRIYFTVPYQIVGRFFACQMWSFQQKPFTLIELVQPSVSLKGKKLAIIFGFDNNGFIEFVLR